MAKLTKGSIKRVTAEDFDATQPAEKKISWNLRRILVGLAVVVGILVIVVGAIYVYARSSAYRYLAAGNAAMEGSEYTTALRQYNLAAQFALLAPQAARSAQLSQVEIYRKKNNAAAALKILKNLHTANPADQQITASLGVVALAAEDYPTAQDALGSFDISYSQDVAEAKGALALLNITGDTASLYDAILKKYPSSDLAHFFKGLLLGSTGDAAGLAELSKITKTNTALVERAANFSAQYEQIFVSEKSANGAYQSARVGMAFLAINEPALALKQFTDALAVEPDYRDALLYKAESLKELHRYAEAKTALATALERDPSFAPSHDLAGRLAVVMGDYAACQADFTRAETLGQNSADFYYNFAMCDKAQKEFDTAIVHLEKSLALNNHNMDAHRERFWILQEQGRSTDALVQAQNMAIAFPDATEPIALDAVASVKSDPDRAKKDLAQIVKKDPQSPWRYFVEATLESDQTEAQKLFTAAIDRDLDGQVSSHAPATAVQL